MVIICPKCKRNTDCVYITENNIYICGHCLAEINGDFPTGAVPHIPCPLCTIPNVNWFEAIEYCPFREPTDCGCHGNNGDDDDNVQYNLDTLFTYISLFHLPSEFTCYMTSL